MIKVKEISLNFTIPIQKENITIIEQFNSSEKATIGDMAKISYKVEAIDESSYSDKVLKIAYLFNKFPKEDLKLTIEKRK